MNLLHLKYAVEVAKEGSFSKAAQKLYTGQPNLSRAITELEETLGIRIFCRTPKGVTTTSDGEEFLEYAHKILMQVDEVERMYYAGKQKKVKFSISVPRASYIAEAFAGFVAKMSSKKNIEFLYNETNTRGVISNIADSDYNLGILRYQSGFNEKFKEFLYEKDLSHEIITEFVYSVVMSKNHPLAKKETVTLNDLAAYTEIAHADPYVPSMPASEVEKIELATKVNGRIFVFERASQLEILSRVPTTFMWVSPLPNDTLDRYDLVEKKCNTNKKTYTDILIFKNGYKLTELDKMFIDELVRVKRSLIR